MEEKYKAIVLGAVDYKDNDKILTLYSPEDGVISAAARGIKRANSKIKFAAQPFCYCEYVMRRKGDKLSVVSADIIESFYPMREDVLRLCAGAVALEYVRSFVREGMESGQLFVLLMEFLGAICYSGVSPRAALSKFLFEALGLSGYELNVDGCHKCRKTQFNRAFFDFDMGAPVCENCRDGSEIELNPNTLALLSVVSKTAFPDLKDMEFPLMIENKAIKLLVYYVQVKAGVTLRSATDLIMLK